MKVRIIRRRGLGNGSTLGIQELSKHNIEIIRNDGDIPQDTDLLIRWGCTSKFPSKKTLNNAEAIHAVNNKAHARATMAVCGVSVPQSYGVDLFPVIVRPIRHAQGKHLYFVKNFDEFDEISDQLGEGNYYISKYIPKEREFGVFIFDNRITSVIEKLPKHEGANNDIAWNVANGSHKFENVVWSEWNINVCKEALKAYNCFNIDFCRVDVMVYQDKPYVLELNSAHSLTSLYRKEVFAKCLDYYIDNGNVKNDIILDEVSSYKSIIHPALRINKLKKNI